MTFVFGCVVEKKNKERITETKIIKKNHMTKFEKIEREQILFHYLPFDLPNICIPILNLQVPPVTR